MRYSFLFILFIAPLAHALDVEPRRWSHIPIDMHFTGVAYARTDADIQFDPALQLEDVEMDLDTWAAKYIYSFESFGKSSRVSITQAYQEGHWQGLLEGQPAETSRYGASDTFVRYAIDLYGAPPLKGKDFGAYRKKQDNETIVGVGLAVRLPTGDYRKDRLINLGQNRYVFRPQIGLQHNRGPFTLEANIEAALYAENDSFWNGNKLEEDPLFIFFTTLAYTIKPGMWGSVGYGYNYGGESKINGERKDNTKHDEGFGASFAYPINRQTGIKFSYIKTFTQQDTGADTESFSAGIAYSF